MWWLWNEVFATILLHSNKAFQMWKLDHTIDEHSKDGAHDSSGTKTKFEEGWFRLREETWVIHAYIKIQNVSFKVCIEFFGRFHYVWGYSLKYNTPIGL